jgi:hypothetical protein
MSQDIFNIVAIIGGVSGIVSIITFIVSFFNQKKINKDNKRKLDGLLSINQTIKNANNEEKRIQINKYRPALIDSGPIEKEENGNIVKLKFKLWLNKSISDIKNRAIINEVVFEKGYLQSVHIPFPKGFELLADHRHRCFISLERNRLEQLSIKLFEISITYSDYNKNYLFKKIYYLNQSEISSEETIFLGKF